MLQGLTPIPYKLVTIASGFAGFNFALFMMLSTVTRGLRYTLVATLLYFFGAPVQAIIEKYMEIALIGFLVLVVLGFVAVRYIFWAVERCVGRSSPLAPFFFRRRSISWATA